MTPRARVALTAVGLCVGILALFVGTVWVLMATLSDDGLPTGGARVAIVELDGIIIDGNQAVRDLREHSENASVKAVVLRINSPGGVVAPTQEIFSAIQRVRKAGKPVVASLGAVAASGGYYVATACDRIYANPGTLTGSIGVIMQMANLEGLFKKVGVEYVIIKSGAFKDVGNFSRQMTPEERKILQTLLDDVYGQFVNAVAEGRGLERKVVVAFADGRIYSGQQAHALKMVDELGGYEDAIEAAAKLANISGRPKLVYPRRKFSFRDLLENRLGLGSASQLLPVLSGIRTPLYLMQ
jgi:protease IV